MLTKCDFTIKKKYVLYIYKVCSSSNAFKCRELFLLSIRNFNNTSILQHLLYAKYHILRCRVDVMFGCREDAEKWLTFYCIVWSNWSLLKTELMNFNYEFFLYFRIKFHNFIKIQSQQTFNTLNSSDTVMTWCNIKYMILLLLRVRANEGVENNVTALLMALENVIRIFFVK